MRKLAFLALLVFAGLGHAQGFSSKDMLVSQRVFTILRAEVKEEIKLTADQATKIKGLFGNALDEDNGHMVLMMTAETDLKQIDKDARKLLTAEQSKRLEEVWIQSLNGNALADQEVAKELKLTDEQKKSVDKLVEDAGLQLKEMMFTDGGAPDSGKKSKEITVKAGKKMLELLTEEQKKQYETMKGKEFKFKELSA